MIFYVLAAAVKEKTGVDSVTVEKATSRYLAGANDREGEREQRAGAKKEQ